MQTPHAILLVDGENLVFRYQEMVAAGREPKPDVVHIKDVLVWHNAMTAQDASGTRESATTAALSVTTKLSSPQRLRLPRLSFAAIRTESCGSPVS